MRTSDALAPEARVRPGTDRVAIGLSVLCMVHCVGVSFAAVMAPALGLLFVRTEHEVHWVLLGVAVPLSVIALWRGYRRHHRSGCVALGVVGLVLMTLGVSHLLARALETPLTLIGVTLLLVAHLQNLRYSVSSRGAPACGA